MQLEISLQELSQAEDGGVWAESKTASAKA